MSGQSTPLIPDAADPPSSKNRVQIGWARCQSCSFATADVLKVSAKGPHQSEIRCPQCSFHKWLPKGTVFATLEGFVSVGPTPVVASPFTVLVDSREQLPYPFQGLRANADQKNAIINVRVERATLPVGDYALKWGEPLPLLGSNGRPNKLAVYGPGDTPVVIERKSKADLYGSISQKRENFEERLRRMSSQFTASAVVVECEWRSMLLDPPPHTQFNPKALARTIIAWMIRYKPVHWVFMPDRDAAESFVYRFLESYHRLWVAGESFDQESYHAAVDSGASMGLPARSIEGLFGSTAAPAVAPTATPTAPIPATGD